MKIYNNKFISIIVPPKIDYIKPSTRLDVAKGAAVRLECRASGNPEPKVVWTRKVSFNYFLNSTLIKKGVCIQILINKLKLKYLNIIVLNAYK